MVGSPPGFPRDKSNTALAGGRPLRWASMLASEGSRSWAAGFVGAFGVLGGLAGGGVAGEAVGTVD